MHFAPQNKEENPLLLQRQSHFAPQNKEDYHDMLCMIFLPIFI